MSYTIREVSQKVNVSTYSIRYYDDHGLLPTIKRDENNNRVFDDVDLEWIEVVACLRATGMSLAKIKHYVELCLKGKETVRERYRIMIEQQRETMAQAEKIQAHLRLITKKVDHYANVLLDQKPDTLMPSKELKKIYAQDY
ncbi:MerR family transcriptional regulator [Sporolactobacillus shoreicorticis]|uniref:MerR family transcriptional regulator n=1 Tax=Sporolactobacillus shoreicorticis TaxID=1923877 RepID=A0ABW5S232_9BACL|nr:MerR family transcriptional regulator [Sporolactobacillus shoreicorticis]MCO7127503.1 MerR family transcriptional regulator [Sporolactobacillus shoreicorticis]